MRCSQQSYLGPASKPSNQAPAQRSLALEGSRASPGAKGTQPRPTMGDRYVETQIGGVGDAIGKIQQQQQSLGTVQSQPAIMMPGRAVEGGYGRDIGQTDQQLAPQMDLRRNEFGSTQCKLRLGVCRWYPGTLAVM